VTALLTIIHVVICLVLIVAVLLQSGKAADLAGAFGGGGSQTAFGPRTTQSIMSKVTTICAVLFMITSLGLWLFSGREAASAVKDVTAPAKTETPAAQPAAPKTEEKKAAETPGPSDKTAEQKPAAADAKK